MTVREDMVNGHGIGHGGLTFALADSAFAFACNSYGHHRGGRSEIRFRAPTRRGDDLVATPSSAPARAATGCTTSRAGRGETWRLRRRSQTPRRCGQVAGRPVNSGSRFSRNAATPSLPSPIEV